LMSLEVDQISYCVGVKIYLEFAHCMLR